MPGARTGYGASNLNVTSLFAPQALLVRSALTCCRRRVSESRTAHWFFPPDNAVVPDRNATNENLSPDGSATAISRRVPELHSGGLAASKPADQSSGPGTGAALAGDS